jgi:ABC-type polysaccharide/polyol phosphate transport system ATPase subunit
MAGTISIKNVSKKYSRNAQAHLSYGMTDLWRALFWRPGALELRKDEFLAVQDVSFDLQPGDSFALVGRNGSGKSTLLKMLCGLTKPDAGTLILDGRVQALINLGAGFNPALSGRENIYNAAALMGLNRRETNDIFDAIVDFSELEEFIGSPVQTYSSGMKARLGFSVAVHLEPDILLIDEILSVGDHAFQNRCFARMQQLKKRGVTIVLVSHAHNSVIQLCERALWLHRGVPRMLGGARETVKAYLAFLEDAEAAKVEEANQSRSAAATTAAPAADAPKRASEPAEGLFGPIHTDGDDVGGIETWFRCCDAEADRVTVHNPVTIGYRFTLKRRVEDLNVTLKLFREDGLNLTTISTLNGDLVRGIHEGTVECEVLVPDFDFNPGVYTLVIAIHEGKSYLYRDVMKEFAVVGHDRLTWGLRDFRYRYRVQGELAYDTTAAAQAGTEPRV